MMITSDHRIRNHDQRGMAAAVEVVLLVPVLLLVCIGIVTAWRIWWADAQLQASTAAAARAATKAVDYDAGVQAARQLLADDLSDNSSGVSCRNATIMDDTSSFAALAFGEGNGGQVIVHTTCTVSLADLGFPFLPAEWTMHATASEAIDSFGER